jgi:hypothetical protein
MYHTNKVKMVKDIKTKDIMSSDCNPMDAVISDERYKLFNESFKRAIEEYLENPKLPETLDFVFRYITNDKHARYLRHFEIATIFLYDLEEENKTIRYEVVFELYSDKDGVEKCDLMSYYTMEVLKDKFQSPNL